MQTIEADPLGSVDAASLLSVAARSVYLRSSDGLRGWLHEEMQSFVPHEAMLVAWGDLKTGEMTCRVLGIDLQAEQAMRNLAESRTKLQDVFEQWLAADRMPITFSATQFGWTIDAAGDGRSCESALVHGLADVRARSYCLYIFLGPLQLAGARARHASSVLLPFIDSGFRQLFDVARGITRSTPAAPARVESSLTPGLSAREAEIMEWVCQGKKNHEIASALSLSRSTVKNHMHRIFQKLDVLNRAQAVECFGSRSDAAGRASHAFAPGQRAH